MASRTIAPENAIAVGAPNVTKLRQAYEAGKPALTQAAPVTGTIPVAEPAAPQTPIAMLGDAFGAPAAEPAVDTLGAPPIPQIVPLPGAPEMIAAPEVIAEPAAQSLVDDALVVEQPVAPQPAGTSQPFEAVAPQGVDVDSDPLLQALVGVQEAAERAIIIHLSQARNKVRTPEVPQGPSAADLVQDVVPAAAEIIPFAIPASEPEPAQPLTRAA